MTTKLHNSKLVHEIMGVTLRRCSGAKYVMLLFSQGCIRAFRAEEPTALIRIEGNKKYATNINFVFQDEARLGSHCVLLLWDFIKVVQVTEPEFQHPMNEFGRQIGNDGILEVHHY